MLNLGADAPWPLSRTALLALIEGADIVVKRQRMRYRKAA